MNLQANVYLGFRAIVVVVLVRIRELCAGWRVAGEADEGMPMFGLCFVKDVSAENTFLELVH